MAQIKTVMKVKNWLEFSIQSKSSDLKILDSLHLYFGLWKGEATKNYS